MGLAHLGLSVQHTLDGAVERQAALSGRSRDLPSGLGGQCSIQMGESLWTELRGNPEAVVGKEGEFHPHSLSLLR